LIASPSSALSASGAPRPTGTARPDAFGEASPDVEIIDVTSPSIATVQRIARALDLSIAQLFAEEPATGRVVRREARRRVAYPGLKAVDEFLTANMAGKLQVILSTIEPGGGTGAEPYTHDSDEEVVVVLSGVLDLWVGDEHYVLREGDAITFPSRLPHWNMNHGETEAVVLFCVTPPSF